MSQDSPLTARVHGEPGQLWAEVAEMPGCFAAGSDMKELAEALEEAIDFWLSDQDRGGAR